MKYITIKIGTHSSSTALHVAGRIAINSVIEVRPREYFRGDCGVNGCKSKHKVNIHSKPLAVRVIRITDWFIGVERMDS